MGLSTIKRSVDFQRVRGGLRVATPLFVIEARERASSSGSADSGDARVGLTITKKLGGAVVRNRIRRRLKAILRSAATARLRKGHDYVVVARHQIIDYRYRDLEAAFEQALDRLHSTKLPEGRRSNQGRGQGAPVTQPNQSPQRDTASLRVKPKTQL